MIKKIKEYYNWGGRFLTNSYNLNVAQKTKEELVKKPLRTEILNYLLTSLSASEKTIYLEIGVRNPDHNFNHVKASEKYSVDPGVEFKENPVDFKMTSDDFFGKLRKGEVLNSNIRFDLIFIDGLHLADQVERDILNSLEFLKDTGYVVLHDCNPPTEWHAREEYMYDLSPAMNFWNGTTWKAFVEFRKRKDYFSCCIDTDWGIGVISKNKNLGWANPVENKYFEFCVFEQNRKQSLNLISYEEFKRKINP